MINYHFAGSLVTDLNASVIHLAAHAFQSGAGEPANRKPVTVKCGQVVTPGQIFQPIMWGYFLHPLTESRPVAWRHLTTCDACDPAAAEWRRQRPVGNQVTTDYTRRRRERSE